MTAIKAALAALLYLPALHLYCLSYLLMVKINKWITSNNTEDILEQTVGGRPPWYAPAQACKWWHDIRHVRIWIGHHYCMSMLACQCNQPKRPGDLDLWPFDLESGVRVTCDVGYLCAIFSLPRPVLELGPIYVSDRQMSDSIITGRGHNNRKTPGSNEVQFGRRLMIDEISSIHWQSRAIVTAILVV